jgi:hypothetical protein
MVDAAIVVAFVVLLAPRRGATCSRFAVGAEYP